ncbi:MAG: HAMP domain-containing protein, partial [Chromatiales bacterium]|nr:HAMP domain-containing protein [Chromatiales bacterium]
MRLSSNHLPIKSKVTLIAAITAALAVFGALVFTAYNSVVEKRDSLVTSTKTLARVVGTNSMAALAFRDPVNGAEILAALKQEEQIVSAQLRLPDGNVFARYSANTPTGLSLARGIEADQEFFWADAAKTEVLKSTSIAKFRHGYLDVKKVVELDGRLLGYIEVQVETSALYASIKRQFLISILTFFIALAVAYVFAGRVAQLISQPVENLAGTMRKVSDERDYSLRMPKGGSDEVGVLINNFNEMLNLIQTRDATLSEAKEAAEAATRAKSRFLATMSHEIR